MNHLRLPLLAATLVALGACQPKSPAAPDGSAPVATVNGTPIRREFYEFYIKGITSGKSSAELTAQQRDLALDNLIRARVVSDEAAKEGVEKSGDTAALLELSRLNVLQQAVSDHYMKDRKATEQELRAEYETQLGGMPKLEYHARHILVATAPFAQKLIARLEKGEKFEDLARSESMDSSKSTGGDLGWFTTDRIVPEFSGPARPTQPTGYTPPPGQTPNCGHNLQPRDKPEPK